MIKKGSKILLNIEAFYKKYNTGISKKRFYSNINRELDPIKYFVVNHSYNNTLECHGVYKNRANQNNTIFVLSSDIVVSFPENIIDLSDYEL